MENNKIFKQRTARKVKMTQPSRGGTDKITR